MRLFGVLRGVTLVFLFSAVFSGTLDAHPHMYADIELEFEAYQEGLAGLRERWKLSETYSRRILGRFDADRDGAFSPEETRALFTEAFENLGKYYFFTLVRIEGEDFAPVRLENFSADLADGRVEYRFFLPFRLPAFEGELSIDVFDETNYITFALRNVTDPPDTEGVDYEVGVEAVTEMACSFPIYGPRRVVVRMAVSSGRRKGFGGAEGLLPLDRDRPGRLLSNDDPFLRDPRFFGSFLPDNPFIGGD